MRSAQAIALRNIARNLYNARVPLSPLDESSADHIVCNVYRCPGVVIRGRRSDNLGVSKLPLKTILAGDTGWSKTPEASQEVCLRARRGSPMVEIPQGAKSEWRPTLNQSGGSGAKGMALCSATSEGGPVILQLSAMTSPRKQRQHHDARISIGAPVNNNATCA